MKARILCPDPEALGRFHLKVSDAEERTDVVIHLSVCGACRRTLILLAESEDAWWTEEPGDAPLHASRPAPARMLQFAAAALLIGAFAWATNSVWRRSTGAGAEQASLPRASVFLGDSLAAGPGLEGAPGREELPVPPRPAPEAERRGPLAALPSRAPSSGVPAPTDPGETTEALARTASVPAASPAGAGEPPGRTATTAGNTEESPPEPLPLLAVTRQEPPPSRPEYEAPRSNLATELGDELERHFSGEAWKEYVWNDYITTPQILLPAGLAVSAAVISHWDHSLEHRWGGDLGNHGHYSDLGAITLVGAAALVGVLSPGDSRNGWDEAWTIGETMAAASVTAYGYSKIGGGSEGGHGRGSYHSTYAFAASELLQRNSGLAYGLPAFGLAGFTAYARVAEGHRSPSDVLAGAAIGTLSAGVFDSLHWGTGTTGGIARRSTTIALEADALKECKLSLVVNF